MSLERRRTPRQTIDQPAGIMVPWGEWRRGTAADILYTTGLEECIGIGVYDPATRIGHMAHMLATEKSQADMLPGFTASVRQSCGRDTGRLSVCLAGGMTDDESTYNVLAGIERRKNVMAALQDFGKQASWHVAWNELWFAYDLQLNCADGAYRLTEVI